MNAESNLDSVNDADKLKNEMQGLRRELYQEAGHFGLPIIPGLNDDKCCRLLAWLNVYGGEHEQVVLDERIWSMIFYAQARLNIFGSEVPDKTLVPVLLNYIKSISDYDNPPEWVPALEKEYGIKSHWSKK
jgi:hypothetical protein